MPDTLVDPTMAFEDRRVWTKIRPVARSLLVTDEPTRLDPRRVREYSADDALYRACALSSDELSGLASALLVAVRRKGGGFPSVEDIQARFGLTAREAQVALRLARRRTNREIAREFEFTLHTARRHTERVLSKLGIHSRRDVESVLLKR